MHVIGGIFIIAAMVLAMNAFRSSLTPYVSVTDAKAYGHTVQVAGITVKESVGYAHNSEKLIFTLREDGGAEMAVEYDGAKPANFDDADKVVAIGRWDKNRKIFEARELLIKCPTKYEGQVKGV